MKPIESVTVYCSLQPPCLSPIYFDAAMELGRRIAAAGWSLVYGGNRIGCMEALADAARNAGGKVIGITPRLLVEHGTGDELCDELIVTDGMRDCKAMMEARGDAFIALPGGLGTFEEVFEIIVGRVLEFHQKPIVLVNVANYFDPLLAMIEHGIEQQFIKSAARETFTVAATAGQATEYLQRIRPANSPEKLSGPPTSAIE